MRRSTQCLAKHPQEVKGTQARFLRQSIQIESLLGALLDPQRRFHGAAAVQGAQFYRLPVAPGYQFNKACSKHYAHFFDTQPAATLRRGLGQLAKSLSLPFENSNTAPKDMDITIAYTHMVGAH